MGRDNSSGSLRRALNALRRGSAGSVATLLGYLGPDGTRLAMQGDDQAPFTKDLPFPTDAEVYYRSQLLTTASYTTGASVDVEDVRVLGALLQVWQTGGGTRAASLLARVRTRGLPEDVWLPLGLVEPEIAAINPAGSDPDGFASRIVRPQELRTPLIATGVTYALTLQFDVSSYHEFRLDMAALAGDVLTSVWIVRSS